ncbi:MAG: hypothetical protein AAB533_00370 [Patescibacteria group bacterium]
MSSFGVLDLGLGDSHDVAAELGLAMLAYREGRLPEARDMAKFIQSRIAASEDLSRRPDIRDALSHLLFLVR